MTDRIPAELEQLGYEEARDQLADVVRRLEAGGLSLEESLALWERGEALARLCERHLAGARERVERVLAATREAEDTDDRSKAEGTEGA
ncbi:MAG TPA: exodeoxyribonuclease VII small subunit [Pseudonocardiaceae bacterium]